MSTTTMDLTMELPQLIAQVEVNAHCSWHVMHGRDGVAEPDGSSGQSGLQE